MGIRIAKAGFSMYSCGNSGDFVTELVRNSVGLLAGGTGRRGPVADLAGKGCFSVRGNGCGANRVDDGGTLT